MKKIAGMIMAAALMTSMLAGCSGKGQSQKAETNVNTKTESQETQTEAVSQDKVEELYVSFGESEYFTMHLEDNETAQRIAYYVGTESWQLPIYHYDDYDHWEIMQYYDIPTNYDIPSNPEKITSEKAGTVYYSEPNRVILYYGDGQVEAEYTPIGHFEMTEELKSAIEDNPVLEGWGNKLIHISAER